VIYFLLILFSAIIVTLTTLPITPRNICRCSAQDNDNYEPAKLMQMQK